MRSVNLDKINKNKSSWVFATLLMKKYLDKKSNASLLFKETAQNIDQKKINSCKSLFFGTLRNLLLIEHIIDNSVKKGPKNLLKSILCITIYQLIDSNNDLMPKVIHNAVDESKGLVSKHEVKFINAILRKLLPKVIYRDKIKSRHIKFSHPKWLINRWDLNFGQDATNRLLEWNQSKSRIYLLTKRLHKEIEENFPKFRFSDDSSNSDQNAFNLIYDITDSNKIDPMIYNLINKGEAYIKDPSTLHAVKLLDPKPNEKILDLCASPGGKSFDCLTRMHDKGTFVAIDMGVDKLKMLNGNLKPFYGKNIKISCHNFNIENLSKDFFKINNLPNNFDGIILDAPCSNTGVIQRKPDIRYRLSKYEIGKIAGIQLRMLKVASNFVMPKGRIVYSTCSIENEENNGLIEDFLNTKEGKKFALEKEIMNYPWNSYHDGSGIFLLIKK